MTDLTVPLTHLALDVGVPADELARRYADVVLTDDLGRPSVDCDLARDLITAHQARRVRQAAAERERDQAFRAALAGQSEPTQARVKALIARAEQFHRTGHSDMSAFEMMAAADTQAHLDGVPSYRMDAMLRGESYGARFTPTTEGES